MPEVTGVVRNSPACHAGVRRGDVILGLGFAVRNRPQAREILSMFRQGDIKYLSVNNAHLAVGNDSRNHLQ
jgi:S1-C subfamily serine protease